MKALLFCSNLFWRMVTCILFTIVLIAFVNCNRSSMMKDINPESNSKPFIQIKCDVESSVKKLISHVVIAEIKTTDGKNLKLEGIHSMIANDSVFWVTVTDKGKILSFVYKSDWGLSLDSIILFPKQDSIYTAHVAIQDRITKKIMATKTDNHGFSTFFPNNWSEKDIMREAIFAIKNNIGLIDVKNPNKGYYGFSQDGKIKIGFYYDPEKFIIHSFFPVSQ